MRIIISTLTILLLVGIIQAQEDTTNSPTTLPAPMTTSAIVNEILETEEKLAEGSWYLYNTYNSDNESSFTWFSTCCTAVIFIGEYRYINEFAETQKFQYELDMMPFYENQLAFYAPFTLTNTCQIDNIRVHDFVSESGEFTYSIRHIHIDNGTTPRNIGLYFVDSSQIEIYTQRLVPDLTECPDASQEED